MPSPSLNDPIDAVDSSDREVGRVARGAALAQPIGFRTAHAIVRTSDGEIWLQRLAPERPRHAGRWGSSAATYLHSGETYETAIRRRLGEELDLISVEPKIVGKMSMQDEQATKWVSVFECESSEPRVAEPEHLDQLKKVDFAWLKNEVEHDPESFTPTLVRIVKTFGDSLAESGQ